MDEDLNNLVYECAFLPEAWVALLDRISVLTGSRGGMLYSVDAWTAGDDHRFAWPCTDGVRSMMVNAPATGFVGESMILKKLFASRHQGFLRESDVADDAELLDDPLYRDVLRPAGLGRSARTFLKAPTGESLVLSWQRDFSKEPFEDRLIAQLDMLRPHLMRTMLTAARLQLEHARATAQVLEALRLPALVFDHAGKVLAANPLLEARHALLHWRARDRVELVDPRSDRAFRTAMQVANARAEAVPGSFVVRHACGTPAAIGHVVPIRRAARDIFAMSTGLLFLTPVSHAEAPAIELVQSLFDLTPAEARVARGLTAGQSIQQIAQTSGVSRNTVRTQVRGLLEKTGCKRQAEAVSLLGGLSAGMPQGAWQTAARPVPDC